MFMKHSDGIKLGRGKNDYEDLERIKPWADLTCMSVANTLGKMI